MKKLIGDEQKVKADDAHPQIKPLPTQPIIDVIKADPHILEFIPAEKYVLPPIDLNLWNEHKRADIDGTLKTFEKFINSPMIVDDFGTDHVARIKWRNSMQEKDSRFNDAWGENILKLNNAIGLNYQMIGMNRGYEGTNPAENDNLIHDIMDAVPPMENYKWMEVNDKIKSMEKVKMHLKKYVEFLSKQKPSLK